MTVAVGPEEERNKYLDELVKYVQAILVNFLGSNGLRHVKIFPLSKKRVAVLCSAAIENTCWNMKFGSNIEHMWVLR